jgi:DNA-binding MarR family transcriptional regulator
VSEPGREENLLGALAVAIADLSTADAAKAAGQSVSAAAALSALHHFLGRASLDQLRQVLGLTHSGAVRLVDRLAEAGLVTRGAGADGRTRAVALTPAGRRAARRVTDARAEFLATCLAALTEAERGTLHRLLGKVATAVVDAKDGGAWICRLCDVTACGRADGDCHVANAALRKYGDDGGAPRNGP